MSDRFELLGFEKWRPQPAFDRETQQRVLLSSQRSVGFLGAASLRAMAERVRQLDDPRCAEIVCIEPLAVVAPPEQAPTGTLEEWARAAVDCVSIVTRLRREGIVVTAGYGFGWARRHEGTLMPVVFAPTFAPTFGSRRFGGGGSWIRDVASWLDEQLPAPSTFDRTGKRLRKALKAIDDDDHARAVPAFFELLRPYLGGVDTTRAEEAAIEVAIPRTPPLDFDLAIEMGEAAHAKMLQEQRQKWDTPYVCWPLAGAYHHRGCVAWERDRDAAVRDVDRAIQLDPHPRYLTTRALFAEALGDPRAAGFHDGAMLAFMAPNAEREWGVEPPEVRQRDEMRSALSRAAFRHRKGDSAGAIADLRFVKSRWAELEGELAAQIDAFLARLSA